MKQGLYKRLLLISLSSIAVAWLIWTVLFYDHPVLKEVLWEIHIIYTGTLVAYCIIKYVVPDVWIDLFKIFIRTMFRVWLIIFITLVINRSMERVGLVLSVTFIFGYFEGLVDTDRWLMINKQAPVISLLKLSGSKLNHILATILVMSLIHILCSIIVWIFYLIY